MHNADSKPAKKDLRQLISCLLNSYQPVAANQKSFFRNDVRPALLIETDPDVLCTLLGSLLYIIARCSRDTSIIIDADSFEDTTFLQIKDNSGANNYEVLHEFQHLKMLSKKIGGLLDISTSRNKETTVSFSFINNAISMESVGTRQLQRA